MYKIVKRIDRVNFFPSRKGIIYLSMPIHLKTRRTGKTHSESGKFSKAYISYHRWPEQVYIWFLPLLFLLFLINGDSFKISFNIPFFCIRSSAAFEF